MSETATIAGRGTGAPAGHYGFRGAARMEWIKLRSLRSTWWTLAVAVVAMIGLSILVLSLASAHWATTSHADRVSFDPTDSGFTGVAVAQLAMAVLGVLAVTGEYSSGMIRTTFAAVPRRGLVIAAKAAVLAAVTLVTGEIFAFVTFLIGQRFLSAPAPHASLGQPGVLRAVVLTGVYLALIALIGAGLGTLVRRSAVAIAVLAGLIFVLPPITLALSVSTQHAVQKFLPEIIAENSFASLRPDAYSLSPWAGLAVLAGYAVVLLGAGAWLTSRRDA
ncbi:MAG TPA: ABC transporter permease [Streptosporangiaceae bacterium]|jgi:ABC-type transport system involved in multi-copper enzyme maturation permease subunit